MVLFNFEMDYWIENEELILPSQDSNLETEIQILVCYQLHYRAKYRSLPRI